MSEVPMFGRIVSIDWSGAGSESERVDLRVAVWEGETGTCAVKLPTRGATRGWKRSECRQFLQDTLSQPRRTLIAMDFGFSLPWGADRAVFGVDCWREMVRCVGKCYATCGTARTAAQEINLLPRFNGHGPYRFNDSRNDYRFYLRHGVAYYRLAVGKVE
jgi:hypothetical protein